MGIFAGYYKGVSAEKNLVETKMQIKAPPIQSEIGQLPNGISAKSPYTYLINVTKWVLYMPV